MRNEGTVPTSLEVPLASADDKRGSLGDALGDADGARRTGSSPDQHLAVLKAMQVREAEETVPLHLRPVLQCLKQGKSVLASSKETGIDRRKVDAILQQLRDHFQRYVDPD
jgi:hypothetical protein